jgi:hypothetical protein
VGWFQPELGVRLEGIQGVEMERRVCKVCGKYAGSDEK